MQINSCGAAFLAVVAVPSFPAAAVARDALDEPEPVIIVTAPGGGFDLDQALTLDREDLRANGPPDMLAALTRNIAGVSLQDAQNNPWQPNLVYRGFVLSPLQGQAQGLAVYLDGARFNQPFGDTAGFDLIPDAALGSVSLLDASPVYGLNALGGSLLLTTLDGRSNPGFDASILTGRFGEREASIAGGGAKGSVSYFAAFQYREEDGWRDFSPSELINGYADLGYNGDRGGLHGKFIAADTNLTGNGVSPVELLAARRPAIFSWPDNSRSKYGRISLHPWFELGSATRIEATLYRQRLRTFSLNGDVADIEECQEFPGLLCLESSDDTEQLLTGSTGLPIADSLGGEGYGVLNQGLAHSRSSGILAQLIDQRPMADGTNILAFGLSYDTSRTRFASSTQLGALTADRGVDGLGTEIRQADGSIAPVGLNVHNRYLGLFVVNTLPLGSRISAEFGLRYNWAKIRLKDQIGTSLNGRHRFKRLNPGLEIDWKINPGLTLRAGYAQTNRAPTPAELSCADANAPCSLTNFFIADPPLRQVVARTWEAGAQGEREITGWTVKWQLSGFHTTNRNDIQYIASNFRGRAYFQNVGDTRRKGGELALEATKGGLRLAISYALTDARFLDRMTLSSPANPQTNADGTIEVRPGNRLPGIPRHSATVSADYDGKIGKRKFSVGADFIARSGQVLVGDEANLTPPVPGYALVNMRSNIELASGISVIAELRNAFNRKYATFGTFSEVDEIDLDEVPDASNPRAYGPGAPRRWSIGFRALF